MSTLVVRIPSIRFRDLDQFEEWISNKTIHDIEDLFPDGCSLIQMVEKLNYIRELVRDLIDVVNARKAHSSRNLAWFMASGRQDAPAQEAIAELNTWIAAFDVQLDDLYLLIEGIIELDIETKYDLFTKGNRTFDMGDKYMGPAPVTGNEPEPAMPETESDEEEGEPEAVDLVPVSDESSEEPEGVDLVQVGGSAAGFQNGPVANDFVYDGVAEEELIGGVEGIMDEEIEMYEGKWNIELSDEDLSMADDDYECLYESDEDDAEDM